MKTKISQMLGIKYPILQGGMAWVSEANMAAAVSNAGGLGIIAAANAPASWLREQIKIAKALTNMPFGVNIMIMSPYADEVAKVVVEENIKVVTTGAGSPKKYINIWKDAGIKVIPVIASSAMAQKVEKQGADAVIAEGWESGGHIGQIATMALVPKVVDSVKIPVIAAGGIGDERGVAAAFMLGATGVQMGTRFIATKECQAHRNYKDRIIKAEDTDTVVTGLSASKPVRALKNTMTNKYLELEKTGASFEELELLTFESLKNASEKGDVVSGSVMAGQISGIINSELSCKELIEKIITGTEKLIGGKGFYE